MDEPLFGRFTVGTDGRGHVLVGSFEGMIYVLDPNAARRAAIALIAKADEATKEGTKKT